VNSAAPENQHRGFCYSVSTASTKRDNSRAMDDVTRALAKLLTVLRNDGGTVSADNQRR
jgi:hypothetical protein